MFDLTILEVAIGLAMVYLILSLVVSGAGEIISQWLGLRADNLSMWVGRFFRDKDELLTNGFFSQPLLAGLSAPAPSNPVSKVVSWLAGRLVAQKNRPSYLKAHSFASALIDFVDPPNPDTTRDLSSLKKAIKDGNVKAPVKDEKDGEVSEKNVALSDGTKKLLVQLIGEATDLPEARKNIEAWYDSAMERVSGWYKRKTQVILLFIGIGLAVGLNADSFAIADSLWRDDALRASVVAAAEQRAEQEFPSADQPTDETIKEKFEQAADNVSELDALGIPLGWGDAPNGWVEWIAKFGGIAFTGLALSLGASFWFDALNKLVNVRGSLKPKTSEEEKVASGTS